MTNLVSLCLVGILFFSQHTQAAGKCGNLWTNISVFSFIETNLEKYTLAETAAWDDPDFSRSTGPSNRDNRFTAQIQVEERNFEFPVTQAPFRMSGRPPQRRTPLHTVYNGKLVNIEYVLNEFRKQVGLTTAPLALNLSDGRIYKSHGDDQYSYEYPGLDQRLQQLYAERPHLLHVFTEMVNQRANNSRTLLTVPHSDTDPVVATSNAFKELIEAGHVRPADLTTENIRLVGSHSLADRSGSLWELWVLIKLQHGAYTDYFAMDLSGHIFGDDPLISTLPLG